MKRQSQGPEADAPSSESLSATSSGSALRRRSVVIYFLGFLIVLLLLAGLGLLGLNHIVDAKVLSDAEKTPPPAIVEHVKEYAGIKLEPEITAATENGPLSEAIGFPRDKAYETRYIDAFFIRIRSSAKKPSLAPKEPDAKTWEFVEAQRDLLDRFYGWVDKGGKITARDGETARAMIRIALAAAEADWRHGRPDQALRAVRMVFGLLDAADREGPPPYYISLRDDASMLTLMLKHWIESGNMPAPAADEAHASLDRMAHQDFERIKSGDFYWRLYAYGRIKAIDYLESPWHSHVYGFIPSGPSAWIPLGPISVPDVKRIGLMAAEAIEAKRRESEILAAWDAWSEAEVERAKAGVWTDFRTSSSMPEELQGLHFDQMSATAENEYELLDVSQCNLLRAGLTVMNDPAARPPRELDIEHDPDNPWRDPMGGVLKLVVGDGPVAIFSAQRMEWNALGTQSYLDSLVKEGKDRILIFPKSAKLGNEAGGGRLRIYEP